METGLSFDSSSLIFTFIDENHSQKDLTKNRFRPEIVKD